LPAFPAWASVSEPALIAPPAPFTAPFDARVIPHAADSPVSANPHAFVKLSDLICPAVEIVPTAFAADSVYAPLPAQPSLFSVRLAALIAPPAPFTAPF